MATIKSIVVEKLQQRGSPHNDDDVRKWLLPIVEKTCCLLPGENCAETNPVGFEFSRVMFLVDSPFRNESEEIIEGRDLYEKALNKLIAKILEERDDLCDYPNLRKEIVDAINNRR